MNILKTARVIAASLFFLLTTLFFVDFRGILPNEIHSLFHLQLVPAILGGMIFIVVFWILFTLLFGRIYCSFICPAGILQDFFIRISKRGKLKKNKQKRWFSYKKPQNILPFILLGLSVALPNVLLLLDPYSNFGRIAANLFQPTVVFVNNLLTDGLMLVNNYTLYHVTIANVTLSALIISILILLLFVVLSVTRGRLFCNTLCPVGSSLRLISHFSLFRITFNKEACNSCGQCERVCKSECINSKEQKADVPRCVNCFNCLSSCKKGGLKYQFNPVSLKQFQKKKQEPRMKIDNQESPSRRNFLSLSASILTTTPFVLSGCTKNSNNQEHVRNQPILPPGAKNIKRFEEKCSACHLCVVKCPNQIIQPSGLRYGFDYLLKPQLVYTKGYCNYECTICSEVCPNHALVPLAKEEKITTQLGIAKFERERCVVYIDETDCGACSEHCPTQAVKMIPYKDSLRIPHVTPDICVGCGGCEYICPARPQRAIHIIANATHQKVEKPEYEKVEEVEEIDFGF